MIVLTEAPQRGTGQAIMTAYENIREVARQITGAPVSPLALSDARADGGSREILCGSRRVLIQRSVKAIPMLLDVAAKSYFGVVLSIFEQSDGGVFFRISMPHSDPALAIVLHEARTDGDVIAIWRAWAKFFALPKLLERTPGQLECAETFVGATMMGRAPLWRRRGGALARRKPRHLTRRRNAHAVWARPAACAAAE